MPIADGSARPQMRAQKKFSETMGISGGLNGENGGLRGQILTSLNTQHRQPLHFGGKEGGCEPPAMPFCPTAALPRKRRERGSLPRTVRGAAFACTHLLYMWRKPTFHYLDNIAIRSGKSVKNLCNRRKKEEYFDDKRENVSYLCQRKTVCLARVCHGRSFPQSGQALPQQPSATRRLNPLQPKYKPF